MSGKNSTSTIQTKPAGWRQLFKEPKFKTEFIFTILILAIFLFSYTHFLDYVQSRNGVVLPDPILKMFTPINLTWVIFTLIYASIVTAVISFIKKPKVLMTALQAYALMIFFRIIVMYAMPLNPPEQMLRLDDPFVQFFGSGKILTKDLFFSGHTATLFLLFLISDSKILRRIFLTFTIMVAVSLLLQHVHYSVDVFSAPFFAYASYRIVIILRKHFSVVQS